MSNLKISPTNDLVAWDNFLINSENKNIYSHSIYLENLGENYEKFFVKKDKEIFASFFLRTKDKIVKLSNEIIYTPVIFKTYIKKPLSSINSNRFEIINEIKNYFVDNYKEIQFVSDSYFNDMRPFFWHNFDNGKEVFKIRDLKYTSIVNLKKIDDIINFNKSIFYKDLSVRIRQQLNYAKNKRNYSIDVKFCKETFRETIIKTFKRQNKKVNFDLDLHSNILESLSKKDLIYMLTVKENDKKKSFLIFSLIGNQAIYLYGGRLNDDKDDFSLSHGMITAFLNLKKLGIEHVDLEGINSPKRGFNKLGYGGEINPYYTIEMVN